MISVQSLRKVVQQQFALFYGQLENIAVSLSYALQVDELVKYCIIQQRRQWIICCFFQGWGVERRKDRTDHRRVRNAGFGGLRHRPRQDAPIQVQISMFTFKFFSISSILSNINNY